MKFILGTKLGMTQIFREDGTVVPVTRVKAGPCVVTQVKTKEKDGVAAVQIGYGDVKAFRMKKAQAGHLAGLRPVKYMRDVRVEDDHGLERGASFTVKTFNAGEKVQVVGTSKGKGFQGVVKRHGFHGSPATHGHKDQLRMPGSLGAGGVQRVFKGKRMGGHMGDDQITIKNLEVVQVDEQTGELLIKGAVPGARGSLLVISTSQGKIEVEATPVVEETKTESVPEVEEAKEAVNEVQDQTEQQPSV